MKEANARKKAEAEIHDPEMQRAVSDLNKLPIKNLDDTFPVEEGRHGNDVVNSDIEGHIVVDGKGNRGVVLKVHEEERGYDGTPSSAVVAWAHNPNEPQSYDVNEVTDFTFLEPTAGMKDDVKKITDRFNQHDTYMSRADKAYREAAFGKNPEALYALKNDLPASVYKMYLAKLQKHAGKMAVSGDLHRDLLPVVVHHGIGYEVKGDGIVYDLSSVAPESAVALLTAHDSLLEVKRDYGTDKRDEYAKKGWALPDGSFPIRDVGDLHNAVSAYGRAADKEAAKAHIVKRARALGAVDQLPDGWA